MSLYLLFCYVVVSSVLVDPPRLLSEAIKACGKGRQWEQAFTLLREMVAEGAPPDAKSYEVSK